MLAAHAVALRHASRVTPWGACTARGKPPALANAMLLGSSAGRTLRGARGVRKRGAWGPVRRPTHHPGTAPRAAPRQSARRGPPAVGSFHPARCSRRCCPRWTACLCCPAKRGKAPPQTRAPSTPGSPRSAQRTPPPAARRAAPSPGKRSKKRASPQNRQKEYRPPHAMPPWRGPPWRQRSGYAARRGQSRKQRGAPPRRSRRPAGGQGREPV